MTSTTTPTAPTVPTAPLTHAAPTAPTTPSARTAPPSPTPTAPAPWADLVNAALLGTERRTPPVAVRSGQGAAAALLDAAAVSTVRRRAALRPAPAGERPAPAPADPRPSLPPAARRRLSLLLADRGGSGGSRRGTAPDLTELLPQWLAAAGELGYRAPEALLPALLDAARARTDLRPAALALAGPRALWLARLNDEWKFALRGTGRTTELPVGDDPEGVRQQWEEGLFAERVALLTALRRQDPQAGLALLASTWPTERAEDRLMFLDSLREDLSAADEPFLEQALSDRSRNVRTTAAELLSTLPGSALAARMAQRAHTCIGPDRTSGAPAIAVEAPHECDAGMQRDGVAPKPPSGRGERSWWLGQLVEATPLDGWHARFGGRDASAIVALPVGDDWRTELHDAWCRAAVRQRNADWARALLGAPGAPSQAADVSPAGSSRDLTKLLTVLPDEERAWWVAEFIAAHGLSDAFRMLGVCAVPWAEPLGGAVVDALDIARDAGSYPWSFSGVMGLAERCLDPAAADRLDMLTAVTDEPEGASPGSGGYWSEAFQRLVGTLRLRATMHAELTPPPPGNDPANAAATAGPTAAGPGTGTDTGAGTGTGTDTSADHGPGPGASPDPGPGNDPGPGPGPGPGIRTSTPANTPVRATRQPLAP
ncbi:DUF5691 domain-containing protein [Streptomyces decoyicus]|uniref:DUF5691 domain-containing protein n=1 Tax=Streptomyces decoyicus TaxID=249567 RepID=A0ABZ1FHK3_9ACTN|nr:DUF5691 domain-containing protein [Streptomyces decoyicus]WSB69482.1 DUF5691 domain-containing protein [Streptomyces decoyicus]